MYVPAEKLFSFLLKSGIRIKRSLGNVLQHPATYARGGGGW